MKNRSAEGTFRGPAGRTADRCPRCAAAMDQVEEPVWTRAELAADLARLTESPVLLWYSRCPNGCHQCFACAAWLPLGEVCKACRPCGKCGGPLVFLVGAEYGPALLECVRCDDARRDDCGDQ
jgi:hypothetical protein